MDDPAFEVIETLMFWGSCMAVGAVLAFWFLFIT